MDLSHAHFDLAARGMRRTISAFWIFVNCQPAGANFQRLLIPQKPKIVFHNPLKWSGLNG